MSAFLFYLATLIVYGAVDSMACLALNVQFGFAGLSNFGFIIFQAGGAYVAAILSMGNWHQSNGGFQQFVYGGVAVVLCVLVYFLLRRVTESPYGRSLRAMRDNDVVADALGKNVRGQR